MLTPEQMAAFRAVSQLAQTDDEQWCPIVFGDQAWFYIFKIITTDEHCGHKW